jgi:putative hydrolase of HD superfamily
MSEISPLSIVQAQLDAYNSKDVEALLRTYAPNAEQFTLHGELLAKGHSQLRERFLARFAEPDLHAKLVSRIVVGNIVTDAELITRNFPEGRGTLEMLCVYEVIDGCIQRVSFAPGEKTLHATQSAT